ncbi:MAG TPA: Uma2 family endonuclease [Bryobacteraceae bacterium]|jgi:Uma2 family endonuclease|nr:Uma2 family endonuclease [Bryobacteraceae bacterium]
MMDAMAATTLLSFEEFEQLPSEPGKLELLDGELIHLPPAKFKHMKLAYRLCDLLKPIVAASDNAAGLGEVYPEMGYKIGQKAWLVPDVSINRINQPCGDYLEGSPALAVEIISEANRAEDVDRKVKTYLANGGKEVWVVYPKTQYVLVFGEGRVEEFRGTLRSAIVPGLLIDLDQLFS